MKNNIIIFLRFYFVVYSSFFVSGCVSDYDGKLLSSEFLPVLNGVLCADSVFSLNLTMSNHPWKMNFEPVAGAEFRLRKNGQQISSEYNFNADGTYSFADTCRHGDNYDVEINIQGYQTLISQTIIPQKPVVNIVKEIETEDRHVEEVYNLNISEISNEVHALYLFLFVGNNDEAGELIWEQRGIYCDSPFADSYNRFYDPWAPKGFSYEHESFLRFPAENFKDNKLQTRVALFSGGHFTRFYLIAATKEYDLYYKGGYLQRSFDPEINLPFTYQPVYLPSNILGGTGIFSGIDLTLFEFSN